MKTTVNSGSTSTVSEALVRNSRIVSSWRTRVTVSPTRRFSK